MSKKWDRSLGTSKREQGVVTPKNPKLHTSTKAEDIKRCNQLRAEKKADERNREYERLERFEKQHGYKPFSIKRDLSA